MRYYKLLTGIALLVAWTGSAIAEKAIPADGMGLSKGSVFSVPVPKVYHYTETQPMQSTLLPRAYPGAPPQIPHDVYDFLPITAESNMCVACHAQPGEWGKKRAQGALTPIPPSHYTDMRNAPGKVGDHLINARYNCNQCHVPQTDAPALVKNSFSTRRAR